MRFRTSLTEVIVTALLLGLTMAATAATPDLRDGSGRRFQPGNAEDCRDVADMYDLAGCPQTGSPAACQRAADFLTACAETKRSPRYRSNFRVAD